jgi:hypothetical protein
MLPTITTTHAIPQSLPTGSVFSQETTIRCCYCLDVLGKARDDQSREQIQRAHICPAKKLARKPAASVPYN